jgi:hypothetical protein
LAAVVQSQIAERLMVLAANPDATPEVQAISLAGVHEVQSTIKKIPVKSSAMERIDLEITLFLQNPSQNTPKLKSSGAPAGPPV